MRLHETAGALAGRALDILLPPRCYACGAEVSRQGELCGSCWAGLTFITEPMCRICGYPFDYATVEESLCAACHARKPSYDRAASALVYDDASSSLVLAFKRGDRTHLAEPLGRLAARAGEVLLAEADLILPVPLHPRRLFARRFNQAALLAREISKASGVGWSPDLLYRRRNTPSQGGLSNKQRRENMRGAFMAGGRLEARHVVLVDDVMTTGATAEACAKVLRGAGARSVALLTLTRVVRPTQTTI